MKKPSYQFTYISELYNIPQNGYFIIEDTVFNVRDGEVVDSDDASGKTVNDQIATARDNLELSGRANFYVDDTGEYSACTVAECGRIVSDIDSLKLSDEEDQDGINDIGDYYLDHYYDYDFD